MKLALKQSALMAYLVFITFVCDAQKFITKTGYIGFYSHTPVEDIKADNNQVASILELPSGDVVFNVLIKSFVFEKALMQEHFNENYMESDKFPKATFKGKIDNPGAISPGRDGKYPVTVTGEITIHGVTKPLKTIGQIEIVAGKISVTSSFNLTPADFNIEIPSVVSGKIAKEIEVNVRANYEPMQKQ